MLYTQKQIKLHQRSLDCLQMITDAKKRIENARHTLYVYDASKDAFSMTRLFNRREDLVGNVKRNEALRDRLVMWYGDIMQRLFEAAMNKQTIRIQPNAVSIAEHSFNTEYAF